MTDGFPGSLLSPDEDLVFDLRPHWISLARPFAQAIAIAAGLALAWLVMPYAGGGWGYVVTALIAVGLLLVGPTRSFVRWVTSHFVLTTAGSCGAPGGSPRSRSRSRSGRSATCASA